MFANEEVKFRGVCFVHCETGTEGALWAFQDERFMGIPCPEAFICKKCGCCWNKKTDKKPPKHSREMGCVLKKEKHSWAQHYPDGTWSYCGLHVLAPDDVLVIFDKEDQSKVLWNPKKKKLMVVDHAQWGIAHPGVRLAGYTKKVSIKKWSHWFSGEYPAELTLGSKSLELWEKHFKKTTEEELKKLGRL